MSVSLSEVERVWKEADCLWTEHQLERAIEQSAAQIESELADKNPLVLVVMKGGLVFGARLLTRLRFPLEVDYIHASRYGADTIGSELNWIVPPQHTVFGRHVLLLDDILDEGKTLHAIIESCLKQGAESVNSAVLIDKLHDRKYKPDFKATYTCLDVPDRYVFGYGMDYKGYLRNAAGVYAVKGL